MKNNIKFVAIILFFSVFIMLISCKKQNAEWKGTIEYENGVTVVKNPKEPLYNEDVFSLVEELSIGEAKGREEYMFSHIRGIAVDDEERIYALDLKEAHIKVFGKSGDYMKTIGKKGQGPGEMGLPTFIWITNQNEIMVEDPTNRRLVFYSLEGKFLKNLSTAKVFTVGSKIDSKGNILGVFIVREEENPRYELRKFDSDLNYLRSLCSSPLQSVSSDSYNPFFPVLRWDITKNDQIVCGYPKKYEIKNFDAQGNLIKKIMKKYDPLEITERDIKERTEGAPPTRKYSIPKYHNAYRWLIVDDEYKIFAWTWERVTNGEGYYYDVFDAEGKYIAKIPLKNRPLVLKRKKFYTIEEDEEGFQVVKRYKVNWNI